MTADLDSPPTRLCSRCAERKSIRGIWYLVVHDAPEDAVFFCESCYGRASTRRPEPAPSATLPLSVAGTFSEERFGPGL